MKAFLSCTAAGLQGACRGPVYLCNNVIRGSVVTRPSLCTFSLSTSPILSSVPISSPPLLLPSLFHHPQSFSLSLIIIQILSLTLVDLRICLMWSWQGERWNEVESLLFKGDISMIRVLEINFPSLYLRDCRGLCVCFCVCETAGERRLAGVRLCVLIYQDAHWCWSAHAHFLLFQSKGKSV